MDSARRTLLLVALAAAGCSTGYRPQPLSQRQVLEDLRAIRWESARSPLVSAGRAAKFDAADGLSQDEAVALALYLNPELRAFRLERGVAEGELIAAGLLENPEIDFQWLHIPDFTRSFSTGGIDLGVSWEPPRPGERAAKRASAGARVEEVRHEIAAEEWRVATQVKKAHASLSGAEERLRLADLALSAQRRVRAFVLSQVEAGVASRLDGSLSEIEFTGALREREVSASERDEARQTLDRHLGVPPTTVIPIQGGAESLAFRPLSLDAARLEDRMIEERPSLLAARCEYERAEQDLRLACIRRMPWIKFGPAYSRDGAKGEGTIDKFGLGIGIELPIANRNEGEIAKLYAARDKVREEFKAKVFAARAEIHEALRALAAEERLLRLDRETLEPALAATESLLAAGLKEKELDLLRYLATQDKAIAARRNHVESLEKYWLAVYDLEQAIGGHVVTPGAH